MRRPIYLFTFFLLHLFSCSSPYKKASGGFEYKVITYGNGKKIGYGKFFSFHVSQFYRNYQKDTILGDTRQYMARVEAFDSSSFPPIYLTALRDAKEGDSIVIRIATDSAYRQFVTPMPRHFKSGGHIYTTIKVLNIFNNRDEADSANLAEFRKNSVKIYTKRSEDFEKFIKKEKSQIESDSRIIAGFLDKHKIKYNRGKWGTFIVIEEEGKGVKIGFNDVVAVNYTGKTFETGRVFDSNIDAKFGHPGYFEVTMSQPGSVIAGFTDALMQMKNGTKARIYVPSPLAFGKKGKQRSQIGPDEIVVFDIEVKGVISEYEAMEIVSENRRSSEAAQQKLNDSIKATIYGESLFPFMK